MARKTITLEQLDKLSIDTETGRLFWDNMEVVTTMSLPWWVQAAAIAGVAIGALSLVWNVAQFFLARRWPPPKP